MVRIGNHVGHLIERGILMTCPRENDFTVTAKEAAELIGVAYTTLIGYIHDGYIKSYKPYDKKNYVIRMDDLADFEHQRNGSRRCGRGYKLPDRPDNIVEPQPLAIISRTTVNRPIITVDDEVETVDIIEEKEDVTMPTATLIQKQKVCDDLKDLFAQMTIEVPSSDLTIKELQSWINGFAMCHEAMLNMLKKYEERKEDWDD